MLRATCHEWRSYHCPFTRKFRSKARAVCALGTQLLVAGGCRAALRRAVRAAASTTGNARPSSAPRSSASPCHACSQEQTWAANSTSTTWRPDETQVACRVAALTRHVAVKGSGFALSRAGPRCRRHALAQTAAGLGCCSTAIRMVVMLRLQRVELMQMVWVLCRAAVDYNHMQSVPQAGRLSLQNAHKLVPLACGQRAPLPLMTPESPMAITCAHTAAAAQAFAAWRPARVRAGTAAWQRKQRQRVHSRDARHTVATGRPVLQPAHSRPTSCLTAAALGHRTSGRAMQTSCQRSCAARAPHGDSLKQ